MLIHPFPKCLAGFTDIVFFALSASNEIYEIAYFTRDVFW